MKRLLLLGTLSIIALLPSCGRKDETPAAAPQIVAPANNANGGAPAVTPQSSETPAAAATGPGQGGTAVGGMVGNQEKGGAKDGAPAAPTGGDGVPPATPPPAPK